MCSGSVSNSFNGSISKTRKIKHKNKYYGKKLVYFNIYDKRVNSVITLFYIIINQTSISVTAFSFNN